MTAAVIERKDADYKSEVKVTWCPGCGDFGVLNATYKALAEQNYDTKDVVVVSGIGCSSRFPFFVSTYGFHGVHGRALPIATGIKMSRPELEVIVFGGDGDAFAIGAGHFVHACRRNIDMCYVIMDNAVYGLTKGQYSPTSAHGFISKTTPDGSNEEGLNPLMLAIASGATYVARGFSSKPKDLTKLIVDGINHKGFAVIDCYSPCPTFNKVNTFNYWRDETKPLPADHDPSDMGAAINMALTHDPLYLGVFYKKEGDSFGDRVRAHNTGDAAQTQGLVEKLIAKYS